MIYCRLDILFLLNGLQFFIVHLTYSDIYIFLLFYHLYLLVILFIILIKLFQCFEAMLLMITEYCTMRTNHLQISNTNNLERLLMLLTHICLFFILFCTLSLWLIYVLFWRSILITEKALMTFILSFRRNVKWVFILLHFIHPLFFLFQLTYQCLILLELLV